MEEGLQAGKDGGTEEPAEDWGLENLGTWDEEKEGPLEGVEETLGAFGGLGMGGGTLGGFGGLQTGEATLGGFGGLEKGEATLGGLGGLQRGEGTLGGLRGLETGEETEIGGPVDMEATFGDPFAKELPLAEAEVEKGKSREKSPGDDQGAQAQEYIDAERSRAEASRKRAAEAEARVQGKEQAVAAMQARVEGGSGGATGGKGLEQQGRGQGGLEVQRTAAEEQREGSVTGEVSAGKSVKGGTEKLDPKAAADNLRKLEQEQREFLATRKRKGKK